MGRDPIGACGNVDPSQSCPPIRPTHQHPRRPPDRLRRRFKLAGEVLGGTSGSDQRDQLFAKLRRNAVFWFLASWTPSTTRVRCPRKRVRPREGLDETLTVLTLHLSTRLQRSLATTNAAESLLSRTRHVKRNVKRWRGGQMMLRWVAAGVLEAVKGFRRLKGCGDMPRLVTALRARDQRLGLGVSEANVA